MTFVLCWINGFGIGLEWHVDDPANKCMAIDLLFIRLVIHY